MSLLVLIILALAGPLWAAPTLELPYSQPDRAPLSDNGLGVSTVLRTHSLDSEVTSGTVAGAELGARWNRRLFSQVQSRLAADLFLETGAVRQRYSDAFSPRQQLRLREAALVAHPLPWLFLSGGAQEQGLWQSRLLFHEQSFPSLIERTQWKSGNLSYGLRFEQAIASDTSTRQPWGNWANGSPSFFMEQVFASYDRGPHFSANATLGHFLYRDLSAPSAFQAQFFGNTVDGLSSNDARFRYAYQGFQAGAQAEVWFLPSWAAAVETEILRNSESPTGTNFGWRARLTPRWQASRTLRISLPAEIFRVQPDAAPALFQARQFGSSNRTGFSLGVQAEFQQPSLILAAEWIESRPIINQSWQTPMTWLQVSLKSDYVVF
jgi:hypothetical protein